MVWVHSSNSTVPMSAPGLIFSRRAPPPVMAACPLIASVFGGCGDGSLGAGPDPTSVAMQQFQVPPRLTYPMWPKLRSACQSCLILPARSLVFAPWPSRVAIGRYHDAACAPEECVLCFRMLRYCAPVAA